MSPCGYVPLATRGLIALSGPDADRLLQGLISVDVSKVTESQAGYGALLTPQGKFLFDFVILRSGAGLWLDVERERVAPLLQRLTMYRLRSRVELTDASAGHAIAAVIGEGALARFALPERAGACRAFDGGLACVDPRLARLGVRVVVPPERLAPALRELDLPPLEPAAYEGLRLSQGVPDGSRDLVVEKATLLESGFEELQGVDFAKGCFVGQELTARMKYRGLVRKRLLPVVLKGPPPAPGTIIRHGEREVGEMRTSIDGQGLALLRLDRLAEAAQSATPLLAEATEVTPVKPDWVNF